MHFPKEQFVHLLFCRALKVFLKAGLTWLSSSTSEWQRILGTAGLGLKLKAVDLDQSEHEKLKDHQNICNPVKIHNTLSGKDVLPKEKPEEG